MLICHSQTMLGISQKEISSPGCETSTCKHIYLHTCSGYANIHRYSESSGATNHPSRPSQLACDLEETKRHCLISKFKEIDIEWHRHRHKQQEPNQNGTSSLRWSSQKSSVAAESNQQTLDHYPSNGIGWQQAYKSYKYVQVHTSASFVNDDILVSLAYSK